MRKAELHQAFGSTVLADDPGTLTTLGLGTLQGRFSEGGDAYIAAEPGPNAPPPVPLSAVAPGLNVVPCSDKVERGAGWEHCLESCKASG